MKSEEFCRRCCKTQNEAPLNPPEGWKSKAKKPPPTPPKGERAKLLGVKNEEQRITMWTEIWFKVQSSRFNSPFPSIRVCNLFSCCKWGQFQSVLHKGLMKQ